MLKKKLCENIHLIAVYKQKKNHKFVYTRIIIFFHFPSFIFSSPLNQKDNRFSIFHFLSFYVICFLLLIYISSYICMYIGRKCVVNKYTVLEKSVHIFLFFFCQFSAQNIFFCHLSIFQILRYAYKIFSLQFRRIYIYFYTFFGFCNFF